jgi:hypothetical protein
LVESHAVLRFQAQDRILALKLRSTNGAGAVPVWRGRPRPRTAGP